MSRVAVIQLATESTEPKPKTAKTANNITIRTPNRQPVDRMLLQSELPDQDLSAATENELIDLEDRLLLLWANDELRVHFPWLPELR